MGCIIAQHLLIGTEQNLGIAYAGRCPYRKGSEIKQTPPDEDEKKGSYADGSMVQHDIPLAGRA